MHCNPARPLTSLVCLALVVCASLVQGVDEDGVSSFPSSPLLHRLGSSAPWGHVAANPMTSLLAGHLNLQPPMHTIQERMSRPLRILTPGVPKRLYFAPRLGKRNPNMAEVLDERNRRDEITNLEEPEDTTSIPYRWWWPLVSVRRSSFSPRPGKRAEEQTEVDLPYDYVAGDLYDTLDDDEEEIEDEEDEEGNAAVLQDKRGSGFAFSPRLGKRGRSAFAFGPRPGKKSNFAFAPRPGKKANFAFAPRPGKRTNFAFAPRPGKKDNFAFAPRPGKKTNFAFSPRLGKKATFAFAPRPGKRADSSSETEQTQAGQTWWFGEAEGTPATTLPPFLPSRLE